MGDEVGWHKRIETTKHKDTEADGETKYKIKVEQKKREQEFKTQDRAGQEEEDWARRVQRG